MCAFMPSRTWRSGGSPGWRAAVSKAIRHGCGTGAPRRSACSASRYSSANTMSHRSSQGPSRKPPLMRTIGGEYRPDSGTVLLDGRPVHLAHPRHALAHGISLIHQEFSLLPDRTVAENVLIGREPRRRFGVDRRAMEATTAGLLAELGLDGISPGTLVRRLPVAHQQ